jgi:hypothetical protein
MNGEKKYTNAGFSLSIALRRRFNYAVMLHSSFFHHGKRAMATKRTAILITIVCFVYKRIFSKEINSKVFKISINFC